MNAVMSKLKGAKFADLALEYGDRVGLGVVILIVLVSMFTTTWSAYSKSPLLMTEKAGKANERIDSLVWPVEESKAFPPVDFKEKVEQVVLATVAPLEFTTLMSPKLYEGQKAIDEFIVRAVEDLETRTGRTALEQSAVALVEPDGVAGPNRDNNPANATPKTDDSTDTVVDEELAREDPTTAAGAVAGGYPGGVGPPPGVVPGNVTGGATPGSDIEKAMQNNMARYGGGPGRSRKGGDNSGKSSGPGADNPTLTVSRATTSGRARGVRYMTVVGIVPFGEQVKAIMRAHQLRTTAEAEQLLEYVDFDIERQTAVEGSEPWSGPWSLLDKKSSVEVLLECSDFDAEVIPYEYTDPVLTSPLFSRLLGVWGENASHRRLKQVLLDSKKQAEEALKAAEDLAKAGEEPEVKRGGFADLQRDVNRVRSIGRGFGPPAGYPGAGGSAMLPGPSAMMPSGPRGNPDDDAGQLTVASGGANGAGPQMRPGMTGMTSFTAAAPRTLVLFRYFDFDVEPGNAYRYRVKLTVKNPAFGFTEDRVLNISVAQGETRSSEWSAPSTVSVMPRDAAYQLVRVVRPTGRSARPARSDLKVVQWEPKYGTHIKATLQTRPGDFVGGKVQTKAEILDLAAQTMKEESPITLTPGDLMLDNLPSSITDRTATEFASLGLSNADWKALLDQGQADAAVTLDRNGNVNVFDWATGHLAYNAAERGWKTEHETYADLKVQKTQTTNNSLNPFLDPNADDRDGRGLIGGGASRPFNPAGKGGSGGYPGLGGGYPGPGGPPGKGGRGGGGRGGGGGGRGGRG